MVGRNIKCGIIRHINKNIGGSNGTIRNGRD